MKQNLCRWCLLWIILTSIGCSGPQTTQIAPRAEVTPKIESQPMSVSPNSNDSMPTGIFDGDPKAAEAWERFREGDRYRVARTNDFKIPEAAMKKDSETMTRAIRFAYVGGDFNRDGHYLDRAFIVVDTTLNNSERFGVVIFNAPEDKRGSPKAYWLFRKRALSRTVLGP